MSDEDRELAALQAKLDHELNKALPKNRLDTMVASSALRTVIGIILSLAAVSWVLSSCLTAGW